MAQARWFVFLGALNALLSVALGAFGAHALENSISEHLYAVFQKASHYQAIHGLGLLGVGLFVLHRDSAWARLAGWLLFAGILLFCGSLYVLALTGWRTLGMVTPLGGIAFLLGWASLCVAAWRCRP